MDKKKVICTRCPTMLILFVFVLLSGCVSPKNPYSFDKVLLDQQHTFRSTQEPSLTVKIPEGLVYLKDSHVFQSQGESGFGNRYLFYHEKLVYFLEIGIITETRLCDLYRLEENEKYMGYEEHGNKTFHTKLGRIPEPDTWKSDMMTKTWVHCTEHMS